MTRDVGRYDDSTLLERVKRRPRPAVGWLLAGGLLLAVELAALVEFVLLLGGSVPALLGVAGDTLLWVQGLLQATLGPLGWVPVVLLWAVVFAVSAELVGLALPVRWVFGQLGFESPLAPRVTDRAAGVAVAGLGLLVVVTGSVALLDALLTPLVDAVAGLTELPTLLSRQTLPNQGYQPSPGRWQGTFLGLSPAAAWGLRVLLIYAYAGLWLVWGWWGLRTFVRHYRRPDWTPTDDILATLRWHRWGQFGFVVVFLFVVMAVFAPALGPTTVEQNIEQPYSYSVKYLDGETGDVEEITVGQANRGSRSAGSVEDNVGPMSYDQYGRYHPFGTLPNGKDLFTFMAAGARISLVIGLLSAGLSAVIALVVGLSTAYYKGLYDLVMVVAGDTIMGVPRLLVLVLLTVLFSDTWIADLYDGGILLALILAGTGWPYVWRSIRGPALQIAEEEWIDAARSFGQTPANIMRKHMASYVIGYLLIYFSMVLGGVIIAVAGLSFLGLGITAPTPEWGRAVNLGQEYIATASWHISLIPGILITLIVMGFNAMGDATRDAIDPQSVNSDQAAGVVESRGGGA